MTTETEPETAYIQGGKSSDPNLVAMVELDKAVRATSSGHVHKIQSAYM